MMPKGPQNDSKMVQNDFKISKKHYRAMTWALRYQPCVLIFLSGLPWAGFVQRGRFLSKEIWTRIVFWPDACLVELTKSYVQVQ